MKVSEEHQPLSLPEKCEETPLRRAIHLLGDTWVLLIVMNLLQGSMRFNALRTTLGHISSKTLSSRLKLLEELGFVQRLAFLEIPPRVEYHLTTQGRELGDVIAAIEEFGNKHLSDSVVATTYEACPVTVEENAAVENVW